MDKQQLLQLLKKDVVPALGCTEPVCVALCAAYGAELLGEPVCSLEVTVNGGIYKNGMSAGIPHCDAVGLHYAATIGALLARPEKQLQLLEDVDSRLMEKVHRLVEGNAVTVAVDPQADGLLVRCVLRGEKARATAVIRDAHTNLVYLERGGRVLLDKKPLPGGSGEDPLAEELKTLELSRIRELVDQLPAEDLEFLLEGVRMNEALADYSESVPTGVGIAGALRDTLDGPLLADSLMSRILLRVASAAESRLDGCPRPTMSSSGAGTKGLVVILPISETAKALGASRERTVRALALGHLLNRYINCWVGKLSPMCSCVMCASTAASAAIAYLLGGTDDQIGHAVRNMAGTVTGMICDGGKVGCALKVATGSSAALLCAVTAVKGAALRPSDGICAERPEQCIRNMARIGIRGMAPADREIISVMEEKKL